MYQVHWYRLPGAACTAEEGMAESTHIVASLECNHPFRHHNVPIPWYHVARIAPNPIN